MGSPGELDQIRKEIENKRKEARHIGKCLIEIGNFLQGAEPERWLMEGEDKSAPGGYLATERLNPELDERFDKSKLQKLLNEIRLLKIIEAGLAKSSQNK